MDRRVADGPRVHARWKARVHTELCSQNTLTVIGLDSDSVVKVIPVDNMPNDVAVGHDGNYAYVTNQGWGSISVIDMAGLYVSFHIEVADDPISITILN